MFLADIHILSYPGTFENTQDTCSFTEFSRNIKEKASLHIRNFVVLLILVKSECEVLS